MVDNEPMQLYQTGRSTGSDSSGITAPAALALSHTPWLTPHRSIATSNVDVAVPPQETHDNQPSTVETSPRCFGRHEVQWLSADPCLNLWHTSIRIRFWGDPQSVLDAEAHLHLDLEVLDLLVVDISTNR